MSPKPVLILSFDTSAAHCAAALLKDDDVLQARSEAMTRGQAERLMPMLEDMLNCNGFLWRDLTAIGVGVGPGNFTGIRIAVSAARGLALGLGIPAVGVSGCAARNAVSPEAINVIPAPRDQVYLCDPTDAEAMPELTGLAAAQARADAAGRPLVADVSPDTLAIAIARTAALQWRNAPPRPVPLYARAADAAPSRDKPPVILD